MFCFYKRYGTDIHSFGQQRDGYVQGYLEAMKELLPNNVIALGLEETKQWLDKNWPKVDYGYVVLLQSYLGFFLEQNGIKYHE